MQITAYAGSAFGFLNKDVFNNKNTNISPLTGIEFTKPINGNFQLSVELQLNRYNLSNSIEQTYKWFIGNGSIKSFSPTTAINGIISAGYAAKGGKGGTTKGNNGIKIELGAGVQRLTTGGNALQVPNPSQSNQLITVYREDKGNYINPLLQFAVRKGWQLNSCVAIDLSVKTQYVFTNNKIYYKPVPADTSPTATDMFYLSATERTSTMRRFLIIPAIGLRFNFGSCKNSD
ncbi:MAG: hypothetical protein SFU21_09885 [Flavihumibacter sp.]|nr:hypothetical protein [Flavihumibacter sp.]